jgi:putative ABC transport system permease protein
MFLALKEMRRAPVRFALLTGAVALLVFLILFQYTIQNGLITAFVGAIRNQNAPVVVYSVDGQRTLQGSVVTPAMEAAVRGVAGVGRVARIGQSTFSVTAKNELTDATVFGTDTDGLGVPTVLSSGRRPTRSGEVVASASDAASGFAVGDVVRVEPGGYQITVVGLAQDVQLNVQPTLFGSLATYEAALKARNPDAQTPLPSALGVEPVAGVTPRELAGRISAASADIEAFTKATAADKTPGVDQVRSSFLVIFFLYGLVVPLLTGLFFLIVTFQKAGSLTLLRAIGASAGRLVRSLLLQVVLVMGVGCAVGIGLYAPIASKRLGGIPLRFETNAVVFWTALLVGFGVISSLVSARRVLRIDPLSATTGAGGTR